MQLSQLKKPNSVQRFLQVCGLFNDRNLFWGWYEPYNFGDWIGPYLFLKITGKLPMYSSRRIAFRQNSFFSVGSVLRDFESQDKITVWGSGIISKANVFARPLKIFAVRGPYTKRRCDELGFQCPETYGDPAILMPRFYTPTVSKGMNYKLGIIPHFMDLEIAKALYSEIDNVSIIDVTQPIESVIDSIFECEYTISSSLHGLIVSQTYGIPSAWGHFSKIHLDGEGGSGIKFHDYLDSASQKFDVRPFYLFTKKEPEEIISYVKDFPKPNTASLEDKLLEVCPF